MRVALKDIDSLEDQQSWIWNNNWNLKCAIFSRCDYSLHVNLIPI